MVEEVVGQVEQVAGVVMWEVDPKVEGPHDVDAWGAELPHHTAPYRAALACFAHTCRRLGRNG